MLYLKARFGIGHNPEHFKAWLPERLVGLTPRSAFDIRFDTDTGEATLHASCLLLSVNGEVIEKDTQTPLANISEIDFLSSPDPRHVSLRLRFTKGGRGISEAVL